ncbi:MAG: putative coat protein [Wruxavirus allofaecicola]|uniref:Coat protein n=1 Tax=Leviviridae sp. TaxID=2027243 RepID=A0ABY3SUI6_9VIRU|nr:MAG: putative coat protein [Leviviridae sp.]
MIGSSVTTKDISADVAFTFTRELPDVASHVMSLQLRNQDNFSSVYGFKGVLHDYELLVRNSTESSKPGAVQYTRHNVEFRVTERATPSADAIPYIASFTVRHPKTGDVDVTAATAGVLAAFVASVDAAILDKMLNFES